MPNPAPDRPFVLHLLRLDETQGVSFRPGARIALTPALRTSGLLLALPGEDLKRLLLVLTFAHANGHVQPSLLELANALRQPQGVTRAQMRRLERFLWQGKPLLHEVQRESGLHAFTPSPRILGIEHAPQPAPQGSNAPTYAAAGREAVIAHSRAAYARPREEAERQIALANGWEWPSRTLAERQDDLRQQAQDRDGSLIQTHAGEPSLETVNSSPMNATANPAASAKDSLTTLRRDLAAWHVPADLIARLLADYAPSRIRQQLDWLPYRSANDPGRFLVAAIQKDYAPPAAMRNRQPLEQAMQERLKTAQQGKPPA